MIDMGASDNPLVCQGAGMPKRGGPEKVRLSRVPPDAQIVAYLFVGAALVMIVFGLMLVTDLVHLYNRVYPHLTLLGAVQVSSVFVAGMNMVVSGLLAGIAAYGLLKRHKYGWWLAMLFAVNEGISLGVLEYTGHHMGFLRLVWIPILVGWLLFRVRIYRPFSRQHARVA